jgi:hypothetical protein
VWPPPRLGGARARLAALPPRRRRSSTLLNARPLSPSPPRSKRAALPRPPVRQAMMLAMLSQLAVGGDAGSGGAVAAGATVVMSSGDEQPINWTETAGIKWCSDGVSPDWLPSTNPFGAGLYGQCPAVPTNWSMARSVAACERLCTPEVRCLGFTWYPSAALGGGAGKNESVCCFRTGGVNQKPPCNHDPSCTGTRCFQKYPPPPPPPPPPSANVTVAVGRRPYVLETSGHVLVRISTTAAQQQQLQQQQLQQQQHGDCSVTATLVSSGLVLSNGSWTLQPGTGDDTIHCFEFSLDPLPALIEDSLNVTINCAAWRTERFRAFQRAPAAAAPAQSISQVDHLTRSLRVAGEPFLSVGMYYSIFDNAERNLTEFVAQQARAGVNTLLLYTFPLMMLHGKAALQRQVLDACDAVGMKVWMDVEGLLPSVMGANTTEDWANFSAVINSVKDHPATLGYCECDHAVSLCVSVVVSIFAAPHTALRA